MAPRRRPRKRNTRMDAAVDSMKFMGFSSGRIQSAVKGLLKEYGGDDGWPFIEGESYRVLIDELLKEEPQQRNEDVVKNAVKDVTDAAKDVMIFEEDLNEFTSDHHDALPTDTETGTTLVPWASDNEIGTTLQPCGSGDRTIPIHTAEDRTGGNQTRVRKPCHGWIDDYDDGDDRCVKLVPGPFAQEVERLLLGRIRQKGRKKRWDVKPSDM